MAISVRSASWVNPADRTAPAVWLGIIWLGMIMGFGADFPSFLHNQPPAAGILYAHAVAPEANTPRAARGRLIADRCRVFTAFLFFSPSWIAMARSLAHLSGHAVGIS